MKLYTNAASPFGRKCRVIARELDIKLEEVNEGFEEMKKGELARSVIVFDA